LIALYSPLSNIFENKDNFRTEFALVPLTTQSKKRKKAAIAVISLCLFIILIFRKVNMQKIRIEGAKASNDSDDLILQSICCNNIV
jgi:transposase